MASPPGSSSTKLRDDKHFATVDTKDIAALDSPSASEDSGSEEEFEDLAKNPFLDPDVASHWKQVYEEAQYESRHVFDATMTWSEEEERRIIRKLDWRICTWAVRVASFSHARDRADQTREQCVMFFALQVDRGNLAQALADNLLDDLGLNTNGTIDGCPFLKTPHR